MTSTSSCKYARAVATGEVSDQIHQALCEFYDPAEVVAVGLIVDVYVGLCNYVATSVFTLAIAQTARAVVHALAATPVWYVVAWSIPGVLVGGTVDTRAGKYLLSDLEEPGLGVVFALVDLLVSGSNCSRKTGLECGTARNPGRTLTASRRGSLSSRPASTPPSLPRRR